MTMDTMAVIKEIIRLYRECEIDHAKHSDNPVTLDYFIDWLEIHP